MLMKTGILYFTTCFHGLGILRHVDTFVRMLHISGKVYGPQLFTDDQHILIYDMFYVGNSSL